MPKTTKRRSNRWSAIRDIRKFQNRGKFATKTLVPKSCFNRVTREIARNNSHNTLRFREDAVESLQEAAEAYVTHLFKQANKICTAQQRQTLQVGHMRLAHSILNDTNVDLTAEEEPAEDTKDNTEDTEDADAEDPEAEWVHVE